MNPTTIDWRIEFKKLSPYLGGGGGVARVYYDGDAAAPRQFNSSLKRYYHDADNRLSIRISREWFTTHLLSDVLHEFARKLSSVGPPPERQSTPHDIQILSGNEIGGDAYLSLSDVRIGDSPFDHVRERTARIAAIKGSLAAFLGAEGRMMVVVQHSRPGDQNHFWRALWRGALVDLTDSGLFLVHMVDRSDGQGVHEDAAEPDLELTLPSNFEDDARDAEAYDDLYELFES